MGRHSNLNSTSKSKYNDTVLNGKRKRVRKYTLEWTLDTSIALIKAVQRFKNIWDSSNPFYKHRSAKNKSWDEISKIIGIPKPETILRWNALRGNYLAFLKKDKDSINGQSANKARRFNPLYSEMGFLNPVIKTDSKPRESNAEKTPTTVKAISCESTSETNDSTSTPKRPRTAQQSDPEKNSSGRSTMGSMMMNAYDVLMKSTQSNDEWDAFGNMIAANARSWSLDNMGFARRYKAALAAVNAKYEMEAAELSIGDEYIVN